MVWVTKLYDEVPRMDLFAQAQFVLSSNLGVNETPMKIVAFKVGTPTPYPLSSTGKRVLITEREAQRLIPQFHSKPIYALPNLEGSHDHPDKQRIGVTTGAFITDDGDFVINGVGWEADFPELFALMRRDLDAVGNSYELRAMFSAEDFDEDGDLLVPELLSAKGVLIAKKDETANGEFARMLAACRTPETPVNANPLQGYETEEEAAEVAEEIGCQGTHTMEVDGREVFMPCSTHEVLQETLDGRHKKKEYDSEKATVEAVFEKVSELPDRIKKLPTRLQRVWMGAFNSAFRNYDRSKDRNFDDGKSVAENRERFAFSVANSQVNKERRKEQSMSATTGTWSVLRDKLFGKETVSGEDIVEAFESLTNAEKVEALQHKCDALQAQLDEAMQDKETLTASHASAIAELPTKEQLDALAAEVESLKATLAEKETALTEAVEKLEKIESASEEVAAAAEAEEEARKQYVAALAEKVHTDMPWDKIVSGDMEDADYDSAKNCFATPETLTAGKSTQEHPLDAARKEMTEAQTFLAKREAWREAWKKQLVAEGVMKEVNQHA